MYVGMAKITVAISQSHSLKDKRAVVRRIKEGRVPIDQAASTTSRGPGSATGGWAGVGG